MQWLSPIQVENDILGHLTVDIFLSKTGSGNLSCYRITMAKAVISFPFKQRQSSEPPSDRVVDCHYRVGNLLIKNSGHPFSPSTFTKMFVLGVHCVE